MPPEAVRASLVECRVYSLQVMMDDWPGNRDHTDPAYQMLKAKRHDLRAEVDRLNASMASRYGRDWEVKYLPTADQSLALRALRDRGKAEAVLIASAAGLAHAKEVVAIDEKRSKSAVSGTDEGADRFFEEERQDAELRKASRMKWAEKSYRDFSAKMNGLEKELGF